jgi:centromeric protein E
LTSVICTVSPHTEHVNLTFSTLRFATRAKNVSNKAHINEVIDDHELLRAYKKQVGILEKKVASLENMLTSNHKSNADARHNLEAY